MTRFEIATLACKILALWMFAQVAFFGGGIILMVILLVGSAFGSRGFRWDELMGAAVTGIPAIAMLVVGLFLWFRAPRLAARMVSDDPAPVTRADITKQDVLAIALTVIGVFVLIPVLRDLASSVIRIVRGPYAFAQWWSDADWQAELWSLLLGLVFAMWLIFGARGIARVIVWARNAAKRRDDDFDGAANR